jgi:hypothetical protein
VVLTVDTQMVGKLTDTFRQKGHLDIGGTSVSGMQFARRGEFRLLLLSQHPLRALPLSLSSFFESSIA